LNREAIYAGLFAQLAAVPGFVTCSRILKHWTDVPSGNQPALFFAQGKETAVTVTGQPTKWELRPSVYLYASTDGLTPPGTILNPLLDAVTNILNARSPVNGVSLLGLTVPGVVWSRVDGTVETDEGTLGNLAVAIVPVLILATD
jgi:hypothetical protein